MKDISVACAGLEAHSVRQWVRSILSYYHEYYAERYEKNTVLKLSNTTEIHWLSNVEFLHVIRLEMWLRVTCDLIWRHYENILPTKGRKRRRGVFFYYHLSLLDTPSGREMMFVHVRGTVSTVDVKSRHSTYINYFWFWQRSLENVTPWSPQHEGLSFTLGPTFHNATAKWRFYYKCDLMMRGEMKYNITLYSLPCRSGAKKIPLTYKFKISFPFWFIG
jgi:hypothetical protein